MKHLTLILLLIMTYSLAKAQQDDRGYIVKVGEKAPNIELLFPDGTKKNISSRSLSKLDKNEDENDDYRDDTQGDRNTKYLKKARIRANTPQARLKRERTEFKKELNGQ